MPIAGVIFDLDGTLVDSGLDFPLMRREMGIGPEPILEQLAALPPERQEECERILARHEQAGARRARLFDGAMDWLEHLDGAGIPRAIFTRNARSIVDETLSNCGITFEFVIARDDAPPKPDPTGIHMLLEAWKLPAGDVLMVGDYLHDINAGRHAGCPTALVTHGKTWEFESLADHVWESLRAGLESFRRAEGRSTDPISRE